MSAPTPMRAMTPLEREAFALEPGGHDDWTPGEEARRQGAAWAALDPRARGLGTGAVLALQAAAEAGYRAGLRRAARTMAAEAEALAMLARPAGVARVDYRVQVTEARASEPPMTR